MPKQSTQNDQTHVQHRHKSGMHSEEMHLQTSLHLLVPAFHP
jgi:hypothetical protein